ncbi:ATP-binding protein [Lautropia mirabilis]
MLDAITLENFKSYRKARLPLAPLTVLIGANASGKSNAIEGMRLLSLLAHGQRLANIQLVVQNGEHLVRGTMTSLPYGQGNEFGLGAEATDAPWRTLAMRLVRRQDGLHIVSETLSQPGEGEPLYELDHPSHERDTNVQVAYNNYARGGKKSHVTCTDQAAIFTQLDSPATFAASHKASRERIPAAVNQLRKSLAAMQFLDPAPARMRDYAFPSDRTLQGDGRNLSAVLYNLWGADRDKVIEAQRGEQEPFRQQRQAILDFIQSLPEQNIAGLSFLEEPRGGVMLTLHETFGDKHRAYDASLLSDGTLRVLSIAAAMLSAEEGSLVVIEEIDNGVHPSRARHLLNNIREIAQRRNLRVLLSTHNPALLDALPDAALPDTLFCYRDPTQGDSRIIRLQDIPDYPELIAQDSLGGLATSGVLERFVKQPPAGSRKERALAWLETLKQGAEP